MLALLFAGAKWSKKNTYNDEFMSINQVKYIQGFMAVCIMMHHIGQETCASWQEYPLIPGLEFFVDIGFMFVAVFMFSSGYGLFKSFAGKQDYFKGYFRKRILPIWLVYYIVDLLYLFSRLALGQTPPANSEQWLEALTGLYCANPYAWFSITMPIFYFVFYICFKRFKTDGFRIFWVFFCIQVYTLLCTLIDHNGGFFAGEWWYNSAQLFWIGLIFAKYESKIVENVKKHYYVYLVTAFVMAVFLFFLSRRVTAVVSYYGEYSIPYGMKRSQVTVNRWICLLSESLAAFSFVVATFMLNLKLKLGNPVLGMMGKITLEFYMIHGLFLEFFSYRFCDMLPSYRITNVFLLVIVVFALSVPAALLLHKLVNQFLHERI